MKKCVLFASATVAVATLAFIGMSVQSQPVPPVPPATPVPAPLPGPQPHPVLHPRPWEPGDRVPGGGGPTSNCVNIDCGSPVTTCGVSPVCPVTWTPLSVPGCFFCECDVVQVQHFRVDAYVLTFDNLVALCQSQCGFGDITVEKQFANACSITITRSDALIRGALNNFPTLPPNGSVRLSACVDQTVITSLNEGCENTAVACAGCDGPVVVKLTFNLGCMCSALQALQDYYESINNTSYHDFPLITVGATLCEPCEN